MVSTENFQDLVAAANQAGFMGYSVEQLSTNLVDAKELAENILGNEAKLKRVAPKYIPILNAFLGLSLNANDVRAAAETQYNTFRDQR